MTYIYKADIKSKIILVLINMAILACSEIIIMFVLSALKNVDKTEAYMQPHLRIMGIMLSKALNLCIVKVLCLLSKKHDAKIPLSYWALYTTVFIITLFTIYFIFSVQHDDEFLYLSVFCAVGLLYSVLVTVYLYDRMSAQSSALKEKELLEQQFNYQVNHLKELILAQEQISVYHDLANHILSLKSYFEHGNNIEGNKYLEKLMKKTNLGSDVIDTGNTVIDAVITAKRNLAKKNNIEFFVNIQIPADLQIDSSDCCVILGNALDNAIEACEKVSDKKYINMRMIYHDNVLSCKIVNSVPEQAANNKLLATTKNDPQNHGIGTKNIKRTLEKYKNAYRMEYENKEFVFSFILYDIFTLNKEDYTEK